MSTVFETGNARDKLEALLDELELNDVKDALYAVLLSGEKPIGVNPIGVATDSLTPGIDDDGGSPEMIG